MQEGDQSGNALGENPEPPERPKPPGSRVSPRPPFLPPQYDGARRADYQKTVKRAVYGRTNYPKVRTALLPLRAPDMPKGHPQTRECP